jgi:hypothetical protein
MDPTTHRDILASTKVARIVVHTEPLLAPSSCDRLTLEEARESKRNTQIEMWEKEEGFLFVLCHPVPQLLKLKERMKSYNIQ